MKKILKSREEAKRIRWCLKWLTEHGGDLRDSELELLISFEAQFKARGTLSLRQIEVLENIYKRHA